MNSSNFITVWEWESRPCLWIPYGPKMCQNIEKAFRQSKGRINLGSESQEMAGYEINFGLQLMVNIYSHESTRIRQQQYPFSCPLARGFSWMWWSDFCWEFYDVATMMYIEDEFEKKSQSVDLSLSPLLIPNYIDFTQMVQINKNTQKSRQIQRHKMTEQYPQAVFQGRPTVNRSLLPPRHPGPPSWGNSISTQTNGTSSNLLVRAPAHGMTNGNLTNRVVTKHLPQTTGASCSSSQATAVPHRSHRHAQDRFKEETSSNPPQKKMKCRASLGGPLDDFTCPVTVTGRSDDECAICLQNLSKPSDYDLTDPGVPPADVQCVSPDILKLVKCRHMFHRICLLKLYNAGNKSGCLQCPTCKTIHGVKRGNQPADGTMKSQTNTTDIPGYPGSGSIVITYNFQGGIQGENHPNPGQPYTANGFPRICYLPNNTKGRKVLRLLHKAFERHLVFTIGTSVTTGMQNTVVWNGIHHKSEGYQNRTGHGYPDPNYLDNVLAELAAHGVTDKDD